MRANGWATVLLPAALAAGGRATDDERPQRAPAADAKGKVYAWKAADGLAYEYFVPDSYDPSKGANLTLVLHGSNLNRHWTFWNHTTGEFRPDDVIVSPDGTTQNPDNPACFNFLRGDKDVKRLHALHVELKKAFNVRATFVYGHSQGSFFSFLYAGAHPDDVQGVLGHASGYWGGTVLSPKHHHQAIAFMHGTEDPLVPFSQSAGALLDYRAAKYPLAHLRALEGWPHAPNQGQAAQVLAWCEGMTSVDPARVAVSFDLLDKARQESGFDRDLSALYAVAKRLASMEGAPAEAKERAAKSAQAVEALAQRHADAVLASIGKGKGDKVEDAAWLSHLPTFLRDFDGVPACDALAKEWAPRMDKQRQGAGKAMDEFWRCRQKDPVKALAAGTTVVREGFLWCRAADADFLKALADLRADPKLKLGKAEAKAYDEVVVPFVAGRKKGFEAYAELNKKL